MMKGKLMLTGLALCLALSGCSAGTSAGNDGGDTGTPNVQPNAAYELMISELQNELASLRAEQLRQNTAYEARIEELENLLSKAENGAVGGDVPSGGGNSQAQHERLYTFAEEAGGIVITSYLGNATSLEVPASIQGKPVVAIGEGAFRNSSLESVVLPSGIKSIGWFAFSGSYRLASVTIPQSVESIEYGAFDLCSSSLRFVCSKNTYASQYAASYGIPVSEISS